MTGRRDRPLLSQKTVIAQQGAADGEGGHTQIFNGLCDAAVSSSSPLPHGLGELQLSTDMSSCLSIFICCNYFSGTCKTAGLA